MTGSVGISPGTSITGFGPATVEDGVIEGANSTNANNCAGDRTTAYNAAKGATCLNILAN